MKKPKFKVGDRVRGLDPYGTIETVQITHIDGAYYIIKCHGDSMSNTELIDYLDRRYELVISTEDVWQRVLNEK
jgi:hypothetical protein